MFSVKTRSPQFLQILPGKFDNVLFPACLYLFGPGGIRQQSPSDCHHVKFAISHTSEQSVDIGCTGFLSAEGSQKIIVQADAANRDRWFAGQSFGPSPPGSGWNLRIPDR